MSVTLGRYELVRPLATGGMAEVFVGKRRGPGGIEKQVVVKRIARSKSRDPRFAELFVEEARLSMTLVHKNIVPVFDFGRAGDELFLVMEFIDGIDLAEALRQARDQGRPPSPVLVAFVGVETTQALDYAHTRRSDDGKPLSLVHHDVTPRNILLSLSGEVKLTDFGIARVGDRIAEDRKVRGTPAYMSPEQARGERVDPTSDLFSLGIILREALLGERVFPGADHDDLLRAARKPVAPIAETAGPPPLVRIINRMLEFDRDDRFSTAKEVHHALDHFLIGARSNASEPSSPPTVDLADWLATMDRPSIEPAVSPIRGDVVTYLADGEEKALDQIMTAGDATLRSMAPTVVSVIETTDDQPKRNEADDSAPVRPGARWLQGLVIGMLGAIAGIAVFIGTRDGDTPGRSATSLDASLVPTLTAAANAIPIDAAAAQAATIDAGAARVVGQRPRDRRTAVYDAGRGERDAAVGTLRLSSSPWATVTIVGRSERCAETPCTVELPAGRHRVRLHNPVSDVGEELEVEVEADQTTTVQRSLTRRLHQ